VSENPAIDLGGGTGATVSARALGDLGSGFATVTVLSSTGRQATVKIQTAFGKGSLSASAEATAFTAAFDPLPGLNASNAAFTTKSNYPLGGYINTMNGQATIGVTDPAVPGGKYYFRSSDPFTISVSGLFPSPTATLTAQRPGTVTITAMDENGHTVSSQVKSNFDQFGTFTTSVQAPVNPISLVGKLEPQIEADLNAVFAKGTYQATETGIASPAFRWLSLDTSRLIITPPAGQSFPNASATLQALRPGNVSFQVVSSATGQTHTFALTLTFANGTAKTNVTAQGLIVRTLAGTTVSTVTSKTLGELLSYQVSDPADANPSLLWTSDQPDCAAVVSQSGNQVQLRVLDYGTATIRVRNTNNGHAATLTVNVTKTGSGNGAITVTL
jgi:hypothetical protein